MNRHRGQLAVASGVLAVVATSRFDELRHTELRHTEMVAMLRSVGARSRASTCTRSSASATESSIEYPNVRFEF